MSALRTLWAFLARERGQQKFLAKITNVAPMGENGVNLFLNRVEAEKLFGIDRAENQDRTANGDVTDRVSNKGERDFGGGSDKHRPVIIAKAPPKKIVNDNEEEWPSINLSTTANNSNAVTVSRGGDSGNITPSRIDSPRRVAGASVSSYASKSGGVNVVDSRYRQNGRPPPENKREPTAPPPILQKRTHDLPATTAGSSSIPVSSGPKLNISKPISQMGPASVIEQPKVLDHAVRIVSEVGEWQDVGLEFMSENSNDFLVVGIVGCQGSGKSTIASFLSGNDPQDAYRNYVFRPQTRDAVETSQHQTNGVFMHVGDERIIVLDSYPIFSASMLDCLISNEKGYSLEYGMPENQIETQSLQLIAFLFQVCHVVIVAVDWFIDLNLIRSILTAEMLKPNMTSHENVGAHEHFPHLVIVHNKANSIDFESSSLLQSSSVLEKLFLRSKLHVNGGFNVWTGPSAGFSSATIQSNINLFLLPDKNFWLAHKFKDKEGYKGCAEYEALIADLRHQIISADRHSISPTVLNERNWYLYAGKVWEAVKMSSLISEYKRMLN